MQLSDDAMEVSYEMEPWALFFEGKLMPETITPHVVEPCSNDLPHRAHLWRVKYIQSHLPICMGI